MSLRQGRRRAAVELRVAGGARLRQGRSIYVLHTDIHIYIYIYILLPYIYIYIGWYEGHALISPSLQTSLVKVILSSLVKVILSRSSLISSSLVKVVLYMYYIPIYTYMFVYVCMYYMCMYYICTTTAFHVCMCVCVHIYVYIHICVYLYALISSSLQTYKQNIYYMTIRSEYNKW